MSQLTKSSLERSEYFYLWGRSLALVWDSVPGSTTVWALLLVIQGLLPAVTVYLTKALIDSFVYSKNHASDPDSFDRTVTLFALTGLAMFSAEMLRYLGEWVKTAQAEYFADYLKHLTHVKSGEVDLEFYESAKHHDLMEQAFGESQSKPLSLLNNFGSIIQNLITLFSFVVLLFSYGWIVPAILVAGTLPGLFITLKFNRVYHKWWEKAATDRRWLMYFDGTLSTGTPAAEMRIFDLNEKFRNKFRNLRKKLRLEKLRYLRRKLYGNLLTTSLVLGVAGLAIGWMGMGVYNNTATLGDLAVFYQVFSRGQTILGSLFSSIGQTIGDTLYLKNLFTFLDLSPKIVSPAEPVEFPSEIKHGITFRNITFSYPGTQNNVLNDLNLFVPAGKKIAIVGLNGAGKSTLLSLVCRFYDPQKGSIEIDNVDIRRFDLTQLRRNISVLFQFPMRFQETAGQNITYGDAGVEPRREDMQTAAERAGAHDFISRLPEKYDTLLGKWFANGSELSGGEWQKVALARAYYRQAQIIVLDEPTSFMDSWGEVEWFDRFNDLAENRTGLIITHRFTIAMRADYIHVVHEGRIIESGTHHDLLEANGFYAQSWESQMQIAKEKQHDLTSSLNEFRSQYDVVTDK